MSAEDELALPQVPEARAEDPEDVSWSLSTAEAMWARGDHLEGIKWVRKAAEAASEVEDDLRALELAKAASELANLVARRSQASVADHTTTAAPPPDPSFAETSHSVPVSVQPMSGLPVSGSPVTTRSQMPPAIPTPVSLPPASPSSQPTSRPMSQPPPRAPLTSRGSARPLSNVPAPARGPVVPRASVEPRAPAATTTASTRGTAPAKPRRATRSRENLDAEGRAATNAIHETAPHPVVDAEQAAGTLHDLDATAVGVMPFVPSKPPRKKSNRPVSEPEATVIARLEDLQREREKSAAPAPERIDWDRSPTQTVTSAELPLSIRQREPTPEHPAAAEEDHGDRQTAFAGTALERTSATAAPVRSSVRPPMSTVHDPAIQTTQAVRVVVWRDANGVHVAPSGTVVSAITIDAVLVVLDEGADLTAWLSRER